MASVTPERIRPILSAMGDPTDPATRIARLRDLLTRANEAYYAGEPELMPDSEFDSLLAELAERRGNDTLASERLARASDAASPSLLATTERERGHALLRSGDCARAEAEPYSVPPNY